MNTKITVKGGYVKTKIENIASHNREISRGTGTIKSKKRQRLLYTKRKT